MKEIINLSKYVNQETERKIDVFTKIVRQKSKECEGWGVDEMKLAILIDGEWYPYFMVPSADSLRKNYNQLRAKILKGKSNEEKPEQPRPPYLD